MDEETDLANFALDYATKKGVSYAEARYEHQEQENFILKNGVLDALYVGQDRGVGVRVLVNGALGFAATNMRTKSDVRAIVDDAIKVAKASRRKTKITFAHEDAIEMNWSIPEQRKLADVPVEEKIAEIQSVDRDLMALGLKIPARYFQFSDNRIVKYFANSEGSKIQSYSPRLRVFYFLTVVQDGQVEQTYRNYGWSGGWEGIGEWDLGKRVIDEARSMQRTLAEGKKSPEGRVTEFLQTRETAAAMHTRSNGAARAVNYNVEAIVRMANTFVEPKDHTVEELLEDVKFGVYMKSFMEWNIDDKRYNAKYAGREAYLVENGEVKHPVRNTIIELTTPAFWSAVDAVGKDLDFEAGFFGKSHPGQALVERLVKIAKSSQQNPDYAGIADGPFRYARVRPDPKVLSLDEGGKYVEAAIGGATDQGAKECAGSFWKYEDEHFLATSNGVEAHDHRASLYLSIRALLSLESSGHGIACATRLSQFNPEKAGRKAGRIAALARAPKPGKAGRYTVVFDPLIFGSLMDQTGGRLGAWTVMAGLSPFGKKIGKRVASPQLTLYDDGSAESITRKRFDAEGVPTRRNVLVNKGVLKTYLHNTSTAKKFRTKTTGNAGLVSPDPHAIFVKPGDRSRDEIFSEVKDGLWLTNTWYTRYQSYVTGDLSTIPRDGIFHIRKGDVVEAWKDIRLTDNLLHLLKNIEALGDEPEQMMWWGEVSIPNSVPYARIKDVGITMSAE